MKKHRPPRTAEWLLKSVHSDKGKFTHLGDFNEVFSRLSTDRNIALAVAWYWCQIFRSIPGFISNKFYWSTTMFKNYLVIACRSLLKNKWFSVINIAGLAVGMACFILILAYVQFEFSFDRFHEKSDRVFRIINQDNSRQVGTQLFNAHSPEHLATLLKAEFAEVSEATRIRELFSDVAILQVEDKTFYQTGLFADNTFLDVFTFPLLQGNVRTALLAPSSILLTKTVAEKLFPGEDCIGHRLSFRTRSKTYDLTVTGIMEDPPQNSHLQFEFLVSVATIVADKKDDYMIKNWDVWNFTTYITLNEAASRQTIEARFPAFLERQGQDPEDNTFRLQRITDIHLRSNLHSQLDTNNQVRIVYLFLSIALIVLLIACINYMNLVTARATARAKEIGIRKVAGAGRIQLFKQFIGETMLVALVAMVLAWLSIQVALPAFRTLIGTELEIRWAINSPLWLMMAATVLLVGFVSGAYPALVLSAYKPIHALRDFSRSGRTGFWLRNTLVVVQFSVSVMLIISTLVVFKQLNYVRNQKLGYDREHVVVIPVREAETNAKADLIKTRLLSHPEVLGVSVSGGLPTHIRSRYLEAKFERDNGEVVEMEICFDYADPDFLDVFKINLVQGRNFLKEFGEDKNALLLNETAVRQIGWANPIEKQTKVLGNHHIVGVIEDFHFASFHQKIEPLILMNGKGSNIAVRIRPGAISERLSLLKKVFESSTRSQPFDFFFLDDAFNRLYQKEQRIGKIFGYFALLAIFIACMGLLGLASYTVDRRTKEIGIRKVLGASSPAIIMNLTAEFVKLVLMANLIAWPLAYLAMRFWLQDFAYRTGLGVEIFLLATGGAILIALFTIGSQTLKAARTDPAVTLRYE